jgi:putative transposase
VLPLEAAQLFTDGIRVAKIAVRLRVSENAVYVWRRRWTAGGRRVAIAGAGRCDVPAVGPAAGTLRTVLDAGPAASGWTEDQRWTLARVAALIARMFHTRYTLMGTSVLLHRIGYSPQVQARRAIERDEAAVTSWRREAWVRRKR